MQSECGGLISNLWLANKTYQFVFHDLDRRPTKLELAPDVLENRLTYIGKNEPKDLLLLGERASSFYDSFKGNTKLLTRYYYVNEFCEWFSARWRDGCKHAWLG